MNNDTYTKERRRWVRDQQDMISITPLGYEDPTLADLALADIDRQILNSPETARVEAAGQLIINEMLQERHEAQFDEDHEAALRVNDLFDTLQSILDYSPHKHLQIIQNLQEDWIVKACMRQ